MNRAVAIEVGRHRRAEPRHLLAGREPAQRVREPAACRAPAGQQRLRREPADLVGRAVDEARRGRRSPASTIASQAALSVAATAATSSVQARWAIWVATSQPAAGSASASRPRRGRRTSASRAGRPPPRGRRAASRADRSLGLLAGRGRGWRAHWSRIRARRRASSEIVLARPRPRTRSSVAWTSSRTPGCDSSAASSSTVSRCTSRPTRSSSGPTAASSVGSVRAATQSSRAAVKTGAVKWSASICSTARVRRRPVGSAAAAAASSAPRTSVRCSTAATTRSFLVGKWCSWAPRLTPARSETSVVDVPLKPRSTRHSTVASRRRGPHRAGPLLLRDADRRRLARHRPASAPHQQTVKTDFLWFRVR